MATFSFKKYLEKYNALNDVIDFANNHNWDITVVATYIKSKYPNIPLEKFKMDKALLYLKKDSVKPVNTVQNIESTLENIKKDLSIKENGNVSFFALLSENIDNILNLKLSPQGAILQNSLKGCLLRIKELENNGDGKKDNNIVKYVAEIRAIVEQIDKEYKEQITNYKYIRGLVRAEVLTILDTVKEVVKEIMPQEVEKFSSLLAARLTGVKNNDNSDV